VLPSRLTVAWISDFPVEWLPDIPEPLRALPRHHPATWPLVLLSEFEKNQSDPRQPWQPREFNILAQRTK
jgi:hypothetical protein